MMLVAALALASVCRLGAPARTPEDLLTRGKLESDLGEEAAAARAFVAVMQSAEASSALRAEAQVRLGLAQRALGQHEAAVRSLRQAWTSVRGNSEIRRFVVYALTGALVEGRRWSEIAASVDLVVDHRPPDPPTIRFRWPGVPAQHREYVGAPTRFDLADQPLGDVLSLFSSLSGLSVIARPGLAGSITFSALAIPWDLALDQILSPYGLTYRKDGALLFIARAGELPSVRARRRGERTVRLIAEGTDVRSVLEEIHRQAGRRIRVSDDVAGTVTLRLERAPWTQALDAVCWTGGLDWSVQDGVIRVDRAER